MSICEHCPLRIHEQRQRALARLQAMPPTAILSAADLAEVFNLPAEALRKQLDRYRAGSDDWLEVQDQRKNEPRILYRLGTVAELLRDMLTVPGYQG